MENSEIVVRDRAIMPETFEGMLGQADILLKSGMLPAEVKTPAAAVAIMLTGRELGIPPMQAFRSVYVVKGKPTLSAQLMGALILRAGHSYRVIESSNTKCTIEFRRRNGLTYVHEFTAEDAKRAGLSGQTWQAYPKAMLFSRCMSAGARVAMPDVLAGMYTPEELADPDTVVVGDGGEVIDVVGKPAPISQEPAAAVEAPAIEAPKPREPAKAPKVAGFDNWPPAGRKRFWARAGELGLTDTIVHAGFGVDSMKEFDGTMDEAAVVLEGLGYAIETTIGVAGLIEALGMAPVEAAKAGWTAQDVRDCVDRYIAEHAGAEVQI